MEPTVLPLQGAPLAVGRTAEIYPWGEKQVVKLFRAGMPEGMAQKEAVSGRIVAEAGVGAPPVGDVVTVDGRWGIVYGRIDGESMLQRIKRRPWQYAELARTLGRLHARMHSVERPQLPSTRRLFAARHRTGGRADAQAAGSSAGAAGQPAGGKGRLSRRFSSRQRNFDAGRGGYHRSG